MRMPSRAGVLLAATVVAMTVSAGTELAADPVTATPLDSIDACPTGTSGIPFLLIHGTNATLEKSLGPTRQALVDDGRCVYGPEYDSSRPLSASVDYFTAVVDRILAVNHADSIAVAGKSQGGLIARAVSLRFAPRPINSLRQVVTISGPHHGIGPEFPGVDLGSVASRVPVVTPAMRDMLAGSAFLTSIATDSGPHPAWSTR